VNKRKRELAASRRQQWAMDKPNIDFYPILQEKTMDTNERFEYMADKFCKETGMMAPGKDSPSAFGVTDQDERMSAWREWCEKFYSELFDSQPKWISVADNPPKDQVIVNICGGDVDDCGMDTTSGYYDNAYGCFQAIADSGDIELMSATHWQPLPPPTK